MKNKVLISILSFVLLVAFAVPSCFAATVLENAEDYAEGAIIYGSTRFDTDVIITAGEAFNAGINESKVWVALGNKLNDLKPVTPYFYDGASWYKIVNDEENPAVPVTDAKDIEEIEENLQIFFVNNEMKTVEIPYTGNVDNGSVTEGAKYDKANKKFIVPALSFDFEFTDNGAKVEVKTNVGTNADLTETEDVKEAEIIIKDIAAIGSVMYEDLHTAVEAAKDGDTVKLLADVELTKSLVVTKVMTLDLNGKTITADKNMNDITAIQVLTGGDLIITGNGTVNSASQGNNYSIAVWAKETGKATIKNGMFTNVGAKSKSDSGSANNNEMIYVSGSGLITIEGGTFIGNTENETWNTRYTLNAHDASYNAKTANIIVKGGTFTGFNPANNLAEGEGTNFLAEGYKTVYDKTANTYTVAKFDANNVTCETELRHFMANGGTVKLGADIKLETNKAMALENDTVLNLNGHTLSVFDGYTKNNVMWTSAKLTITGNGTIDARINEKQYTYAVYAFDGGNVTIENGSYIGIHGLEDYEVSLIYCQGENSLITILDGTFIGDDKYTLNLKDEDYEAKKANIVVKGGTYTGFNPANNLAEGEGTNFLADGYRSVYNKETNTYTVKAYDINNVDDDDSLKYALAHAKESDTINLAAGNYSKVLIDSRKNVAKNITLVGTEGVNIAGVNMNGAHYGFVPEGLTFKNITFTDDISVNNTDKWGSPSKNLSIIGCTFINAGFSVGNKSTVDGLTIKDNKFNGTSETKTTSILLQGSHTNVLIKGNVIDGSAHNAVQCTGVVGKINIDGNTMKNIGSRAIRITTLEGADLTISNNTISNVNTVPKEAEENMGQVIKITGTVTSPIAEANTYNGEALNIVGGIATIE